MTSPIHHGGESAMSDTGRPPSLEHVRAGALIGDARDDAPARPRIGAALRLVARLIVALLAAFGLLTAALIVLTWNMPPAASAQPVDAAQRCTDPRLQLLLHLEPGA